MSYYTKKNPILTRPATADEHCVRVQLDNNTVVLLKNMNSFTYWKERYPNARVIDPFVVGKSEKAKD